MNQEIAAWEGEGGFVPGLASATMSGSESQVEWAGRIRRQVNNEFDRVAAAFQVVANRQSGSRRADTEAIIAILEDKRADVMRHDRAGYFIHDWQEMSGQVRKMISDDDRYQAIKSHRQLC